MLNNKVVVLIPIYKEIITLEEKISLNSVKQNLNGIDVILIGPNKIKKFIINLSIEMGIKTCLQLFDDKYFKSISGYNRLLMSKHFYKKFEYYKFILIVQTDALIIGKTLDLLKFCDLNYSYIGAPWVDGDYNSKVSPKISGVGNGGLSLRNIKDHLAVLNDKNNKMIIKNEIENYINQSYFGISKIIKKNILKYGLYNVLPVINEDRYWSCVVPAAYEKFTVASISDAIKFSFEDKPSYLYKINDSILPFGCHAWERYDKKFWVEHLCLDI